MKNHFMDRVSAYVDGELDAAGREVFEGRMAEDPQLRAAVEDVQAMVGAAAGLGPIEPPAGVWAAIEARITASPGAVSDAATVPIAESATAPAAPQATTRRTPAPRPYARHLQAIAAGLVLMVLSASAGWWLHDFGTPTPDQLASIEQPVAEIPVGDASVATFNEQEDRLTESIHHLELLLGQYGDRLDPDTREAIAQNLDLIDGAINDAHRALEQDPNSDYLRSSIANSMERKVRLLEDATRLASREI
ncbi:hypothetical protein DRQ53_09935 [bacterium]|nr:MAG: hypothetical protein DRQ53_09935 [bacterium]